jgi:hypothetical protein
MYNFNFQLKTALAEYFHRLLHLPEGTSAADEMVGLA